MKKIFTILLVFLTLTSCLGTKKVTESNTSFSESKEVTDLFDSKIETSGEIKDEITINVPQSSNPEINKELVSLIKRMESSKSSGNNGYKLYYDEKLKALKLQIQIAETKDTNVLAVKETKTESTFEESLDKYVRKFVIPWWLYIVGLFFIRKEIFWILKKIFPALRAFSIFKPRNPKVDFNKIWKEQNEQKPRHEAPKPSWAKKIIEQQAEDLFFRKKEDQEKWVKDKKRQEFEAKEKLDNQPKLETRLDIDYKEAIERLENFDIKNDFLIEQSKNMKIISDQIISKGKLSPEEKRRIEDILNNKKEE